MNYRRLKDITERVVVTFVGAFIGIYLFAFAQGQADLAFLRDPGLFEKGKQAGIAATVPLVLGLFGLRIGDKNTGSIIPSNKPLETPGEPDKVENPEPAPVATEGPADVSQMFQYWYKEEGA